MTRLLLVVALLLSMLDVFACTAAEPPAPEKEVRVAIVKLGEPSMDAIGPFINAASLRASLQKLPQDDPVDVLVLRINSPGGLLLETPRLSDLIEKELKPKQRVVIWVDRALSAAALASLTSDSIVMTSKGAIGAAVTFTKRSGKVEALTGSDLESALTLGQEMAQRGKHEPLIARSMQTTEPLSCDLGAAGPVNFKPDETGSVIVNRAGEILTLTGDQAALYGLSLGTADSPEDLMKVLGYAKWTTVGQDADSDQSAYRLKVRDADLKVQDLRIQRDQALEQIRTTTDPDKRKTAMMMAGRLDAEVGKIFKQYPSLREYYAATTTLDPANPHAQPPMQR